MRKRSNGSGIIRDRDRELICVAYRYAAYLHCLSLSSKHVVHENMVTYWCSAMISREEVLYYKESLVLKIH